MTIANKEINFTSKGISGTRIDKSYVFLIKQVFYLSKGDADIPLIIDAKFACFIFRKLFGDRFFSIFVAIKAAI